MKVLLDAGLPSRTCSLQRALQHEVVHANDIRLGISDRELLIIAAAEHRVIVTFDADFHAMLALNGAVTPSVIRLRLQSLRHEEACELIDRILRLWEKNLVKGAAISADRRRIRVRDLPLA